MSRLWILGALLLAGCGGSGSSWPSGPGAGSSAPPTTLTAPSPVAVQTATGSTSTAPAPVAPGPGSSAPAASPAPGTVAAVTTLLYPTTGIVTRESSSARPAIEIKCDGRVVASGPGRVAVAAVESHAVHVVLDHGAGFHTIYTAPGALRVSVGDSVARRQVLIKGPAGSALEFAVRRGSSKNVMVPGTLGNKVKRGVRIPGTDNVPSPPSVAPVVVLGYYAQKDLPDLLTALAGSGMPSSTQVLVGTYGASSTQSQLIHGAGASYAPMFTFVRDSIWDHRPVGGADARLLASQPDAIYSGTIPTLHDLVRLPQADRIAWSLELGRRFRDDIRPVQRGGSAVDSWQLDEVMPSSTGPFGPELLELEGNTLRGLHEGRPLLGDAPVPGLVYVSNTALALAARPLDPDLEDFFEAVDETCFVVAGEEYPEFTGGAAATAEGAASPQFAFWDGGSVRQRLGARYVSCLQPGLHLSPFLGGNVLAWPMGQVNTWRQAFLVERARDGVAGFAEFNWRFENADPQVMSATLQEVATALASRP